MNKVRVLEKGTERFENPRDKRVTGKSGSFANEPCVSVGQADWGQADWGRAEWGRSILAAKLLHQLDKPTGGKTKLGNKNDSFKYGVNTSFL